MDKILAADRRAPARVAVSMMIGALLALQAWQTFPIARWLIAPDARGWRGALRWWPEAPWLYPFIDYPMYAQARERGEATLEPRVRATLEDGSGLDVGPADLGLDYFMFHEQVVGAIHESDVDRLRTLLRPIEARRRQRVSLVELQIEPIRWLDHGIERGPLEPRSRVTLGEPADGAAGRP
jgi:hypothetical protein